MMKKVEVQLKQHQPHVLVTIAKKERNRTKERY